MPRVSLTTNHSAGASLVEVVLAIAVFSVIVTGLIGAIIYGQESPATAGARTRAIKIAEEGIEAVRNIRDSGYNNLPADGTYGLAISGGVWTFSGSSDTTGIFSRTVTLATIDARTRRITVNVNWGQTAQRNGLIALNTYLTDWLTPSVPPRNGMLVFGDGGTSSDFIKYKIYDDSNGTWSTAANTADIDSATTNKHLRAVRVYSSPTRNEKIMISRHYNGSIQFIYAQVWNGSSWGSVQLLSSWTANTFLDAQNFDGTYLANGDFVAVYNDFSATPKFRTWNGSAWSSQFSMQANQAYPVFVTTKARPGTNEIMTVFAGQGKRTETQYYNGAGYNTANWTLTQHATNATANTVKFADFDWSPNSSTIGVLVYEANTKYVIAKTFTANNSGGGSWSTAVNGPNQTSNAMNVSINGRNGANEFVTCNKDNNANQDLTCLKIDSAGPAFSTPSNNLLTTKTSTGIQFSMGFGYQLSGTLGLAVYSDNTLIPKYRTYNPVTNGFSSAFSLNILSGVLNTVRAIPKPDNNDALVLMGDNALDVHSVVWDGTNENFYTSPTGKTQTTHGTNGSATTDYWYDFAWDGM